MNHLLLTFCLARSACSQAPEPAPQAAAQAALYPNETRQMRALIVKYAQIHDIPEDLLHAVIQRESDYRPRARNGTY